VTSLHLDTEKESDTGHHSRMTTKRPYPGDPATTTHRRSCVVYNFGLDVCHTITFESLDVGSSYLHMRYISMEYRSSSYLKVIGSRSRSEEQKGRKFLFSQGDTSRTGLLQRQLTKLKLQSVTQLDSMAKRTTTGTVPSSGRGGTTEATAQNEQTAEEHSTHEQQPPGRLDHPACCVVWTV